MKEHETQIRVRYAETDRMGFLHHAQYFVYFEEGRTELLRASGQTYKAIEDQGYFLVIAKIECKFRLPIHYDDVIRLRTILHRVTPVRIEHRYEMYRGEELCAEGFSTLACVDRSGKLQPMPEALLTDH
ncbi:MAG TPA: thioesterase family protein [Gemmatales bacterium]|nr:thioesterase family protein [Gemmatales bacterium]